MCFSWGSGGLDLCVSLLLPFLCLKCLLGWVHVCVAHVFVPVSVGVHFRSHVCVFSHVSVSASSCVFAGM